MKRSKEVSKIWLKTVLDSAELLREELLNHSEDIEDLLCFLDESEIIKENIISKVSDIEADAFMMKERALSIHLSLSSIVEAYNDQN